MTTFGQALRKLMKEHPGGMSIRGLARAVPCDAGHLSRIVRDMKTPSPELARALEAVFDAPDALVPFLPPPGKRAEDTLSFPGAASTVEGRILPGDGNDMDRRLLLHLAALGIGAGAFASGEGVRQLLDLVVSSETRSLEDWHVTASDHLHALRTQPPVQVRDGLAIDLLALQRQLRAADEREALELQRYVAALAMLQAHTLTRLANHTAAIHWWRTARRAADNTGDLDLRMMVRCEEAGVGLYGQRDLATILALIDDAERIAGGRPSYWKADLAGTRAKALALLGRHGEAERALVVYADYGGPDTPPSVLPALWKPDQVAFAQSWVHAYRGNESAADEARERVLAAGGAFQYGVNVRLHEALCAVVNGGVKQGALQAAAVLEAVPTARMTQMITEVGATVLRAVPPERRDDPAVQEFREVLVTTAPAPPRAVEA